MSPPRAILVVDDYGDSLHQAIRLLTGQGYRVRPAREGAVALASAAVEVPDLVLLNLSLPDLDGYQVCGRLKEEPRTAGVPVIFVGALDEAFDKVKILSFGGTDFVTRPYEPEELLARIDLQLRLRDYQTQIEAQNLLLQREVERRTQQLVGINAELKQEIAQRRQIEQALRDSEARYRTLFEVNPQPMWVCDQESQAFLAVNNAALVHLGYSQEEFLRMGMADLGVPEATLPSRVADRQRRPVRVRARDGRELDVQLSTAALDFLGRPALVVMGLDVTERLRAEHALRDSERRYRLVVQNAPIIIFIINRRGVFLLAEGLALEQLGLVPGEVVGESVFDRYPDQPAFLASICEALAGTTSRTETQIGDFTFETAYAPYYNMDGRADGVIGVAVDTTERTRVRARLLAAVREKEVLLREIYHRVKNNLQVVASLLGMQGLSIPDPAMRDLFDESANRVRAMMMVHEQLYQSGDLASISFDDYLRQLLGQLERPFARPEIAVEQHLEPVSLGLETAIPCGLIVNELVTNAFKHAFPGGRGGRLAVDLGQTEGDILLAISDTGVGLPAGFVPERSKSLGWRLVVGLANQIEGQLHIVPSAGTHVELRFREDHRETRRYGQTLGP